MAWSKSEKKRFEQWLMSDERAENTIASYLDSVTQFFREFRETNQENVLAWKSMLAAKFKPKTVNIRLCGIHSYARFKEIILKVKPIKEQRALSLENVITASEYSKLLNDLRDSGCLRDYWMVAYLAQTGVRVSEFVRLTWAGAKSGHEDMFTKGKVRRIYYPAGLVEESRSYFEKNDNSLLFPNRYGQQMTTRGVGQLLAKMGKRFRVRKEVMHPHGFRHFFAKEFLRKGGDLSMLCALMGHDNINTTSIYTKNSAAEILAQLSNTYKKGACA